MRKVRNISVMAMASLGAIATAASAQSVPSAGDGDAAAPEEIIVTAQRRSEKLQDVPISISVLGGERMEALAIQNTTDIFKVTPGITLQNSNGFLNPRIRGVGSTSAGPGVENSVALYVDGVYLASSPATFLSLVNVERVEVLKGPQGTLFGRNATGGLIQIVMKDPKDSFGGQASLSYGNYDTIKGNFYVTGPISSGISADISASVSHQGNGFSTNLATGKESYKTRRDITVRSKLLAKLGDLTTARLSLDYGSQRSSDPSFAPIPGTKTPAWPSLFNPSNVRDVSTDVDAYHNVDAGGVTLRVDHDFDFATFTNISAYRQMRYTTLFDGDISPTPVSSVFYKQNDDQFSQEFQLASNGSDRLKWIVGAYYFHLKGRYDPYVLTIGLPAGTGLVSERTLLQTSITRSMSGYAQVSYEFLPRTTFTAGIRYTDEVRKLSGTTRTRTPLTSTTVPNADRVSKSVPTWRLVLDHKFTDDVMAYISYNRGFKSGGYSPAAPTVQAYAPEYLDAFEGGLKTSLWDGRLRLNAEGYYYKYKDIQVNTYQGIVGIVYNGASAEVYGADVDFDLSITRQFKVFGGLSLIHDRFTSFPLAVIARPLPDGTATSAPGSATGNKLPLTADATISLGASLNVPLSSGSLDFVVNNLYSSGYYTQPDNFLRQRKYNMLNGSIVWNSEGDRFSLKVWGNNLLNKAVIGSLTVNAGGSIAGYQPPRTYGVTAGVKF